jgi:hypothetical protein
LKKLKAEKEALDNTISSVHKDLLDLKRMSESADVARQESYHAMTTYCKVVEIERSKYKQELAAAMDELNELKRGL